MDWKRRLITASGKQVCATPVVFSWAQWMGSLSHQIPAMPVAFNRLQERQLWQQIIRNELSDASTAAVRGLAKHASAAYALMQQYDIHIHELQYGGEESEALSRWIRAMHKQLSSKVYAGRILQADMDAALLSHFKQLVVPQSVMLDVFVEFAPQQQQFIEALESAGTAVLQLEPSQSESMVTLTTCTDTEAECRHIASRCKALLDQDPGMRIAISAAESASDINRLNHYLNHVLMPEAASSPVCSEQPVSVAGDALVDIPMIQQLLHVLSFGGQGSITFDDFSGLLFSPWLKGYENERLLRAELDATFRRQNRHKLSFKGLLQSSYVQALPQLLSVIKALSENKPGSQSAVAWVDHVHELLKASGFVVSGRKDETRRSNMEIRQMNAFRDVLISLVAVDAVCGQLSWVQFLSMLRSACAENRLALAAKFPNVMVMPLHQLSGLKFDHVLVSGLNEEAFPPAAKVNPMLPAGLQQQKRIPMSSGALAFEYAQQLWLQLLQAAPAIEISYAKQKDEKELLASPFTADLNKAAASKSISSKQPLALESFEDAPDVPFASNENVHGGTAIIKNQSACPFRAFAVHRLGIDKLGETSPGIEASSKGSLIHLALEHIWKQLQTQAALVALNDDEMMGLIDAAISHAWQESHVVANARTQGYEQKRMRRILSEWLGKEKERPDFKVIAIEQKYCVSLPELSSPQFNVNIKADRMDEDEHGRRILIDYKTGAKQSTARWLLHEDKQRIEEPQLPQYALAAELGIDDAVAFARVRSGDMAYEGLSGEDIGIKGVTACDGKRNAPEDWQQVLDDWKANINMLASEFVQGRCEVSPRDTNACQYCGLEAVCRINETGFDTEVGEA